MFTTKLFCENIMEVSKVVHTKFVVSNGPGGGEQRDACHASPFLPAGTLDQKPLSSPRCWIQWSGAALWGWPKKAVHHSAGHVVSVTQEWLADIFMINNPNMFSQLSWFESPCKLGQWHRWVPQQQIRLLGYDIQHGRKPNNHN